MARKNNNKKTLDQTHPHLLDEWDYGRNTIKPNEVTYGSDKKPWWVCKVCGYGWSSRIANRTRLGNGCPKCGEKRRKQILLKNKIAKNGSLLTNFPEIAKDWHPTKNKGIVPDNVLSTTNKKFFWFCSKCEHVWKASVCNRIYNKSGCPACANLVPTKTNNLLIKFPEIAKEWDEVKNKRLAESVTFGSTLRAWWLCSKCNYSWSAVVYSRTSNNRGCPRCGIKRAKKTKNKNKIKEHGNLFFVCPDICKEWDYKKNGKLDPSNLQSRSKKRVWWICSRCGHSWKVCIKNRTVDGSGCPFCCGSSVSKVSQKWLDSFKIPHMKREHKIDDLGFRVDGFDPKTNTVYEFLGDYWHGNPKKFEPDKTNERVKVRYKDLYQETMDRFRLLVSNGYTIVYIWEKDYKRIFESG